MSTRYNIEAIDEQDEEDTQQLQHVAEVDEQDVRAMLEIVADYLRHVETGPFYDYVVHTLQERAPRRRYMDHTTAIAIGQELNPCLAKACDEYQGMLNVMGGAR